VEVARSAPAFAAGSETARLNGFVPAHSWRKDKDRARMGHPEILLRWCAVLLPVIGSARRCEIYFSFRSEMKSLRASQELTVLTALFLPVFSAHRSKSWDMSTCAKWKWPLAVDV